MSARVAQAKARLRERMLRERAALDDSTLTRASEAIHARMLALDAVRSAGTIGLYIDAGRGEVQTRPLLAALATVRLAAPRVVARDEPLAFHRVRHLQELVPGALGLREPAASSEAVALDSIDVMLVPGLAFDRGGGRLGFGRGYYDHTLPRTRALRIGLALELQIVEEVPRETHDQLMDIVITEARTIECHRTEPA